MDELDEVTDSAHHGEADCDGAADLEVLCKVGGGKGQHRTRMTLAREEETRLTLLVGLCTPGDELCARAKRGRRG